jgi:hypothetical protein
LFLSAEQIPYYRQRGDQQHGEDCAAADTVHGICPVCAENHSLQQIDRLCRLIPIVTEESAMSQISKPINSEQVSFSGQVLADNELDSVSGGSPFSMLQNAFSNVIKNIGDGLAAAARKG